MDIAKGKQKRGHRAAKGKLKKSLLTIQQRALQYRLMFALGRQETVSQNFSDLLTIVPMGCVPWVLKSTS